MYVDMVQDRRLRRHFVAIYRVPLVCSELANRVVLTQYFRADFWRILAQIDVCHIFYLARFGAPASDSH